MEPPAAVSLSSSRLGSFQHASSLEKNRREMMLRIEPHHHITYATSTSASSHIYEELPENFLESISPQQTTNPVGSLVSERAGGTSRNDLSAIAAASSLSPGSLSLGGGVEQRFMNENVDFLPHISASSADHHHNHHVHAGGAGASLLSTSMNRCGSADDLASAESRRSSLAYIKEESPDLYAAPSSSSANVCGDTIYHLRSTYENETDEEGGASVLASGLARAASPLHHHQHDIIGPADGLQDERYVSAEQTAPPLKLEHTARESRTPDSHAELGVQIKSEDFSTTIPGGAAYFHTANSADPLDTDDDNIFIDTKDLCNRIASELKQHSIPQAVFAERILCRSQGTLSDLLRNPKPWDKLKSGRDTFKKMLSWLNQPLHARLAILDIQKSGGGADVTPAACLVTSSSPIPTRSRPRPPSLQSSEDGSSGYSYKRPRLVFSDVQKRTLQAIFKETQRPSREMQTTIAGHLGLDLSTVSNFFMNARRRSRNGLSVGADTSGHEQATPPPGTPTKSGSRRQKVSSSSAGSSSGTFDSRHLDETLEAVISGCGGRETNEAPATPKKPSRSRRSRRNEPTNPDREIKPEQNAASSSASSSAIREQ